MTTIVFKQGIMASDGMTTDGRWAREEDTSKLYFNEKHNIVVGISGAAEHFPTVAEWAMQETLFDKRIAFPPGDYCVIAARNLDGQIYTYSGYHGQQGSMHMDIDTARYMAEGSGREFATGAMEYGANALEAVKVAERCDTATGGSMCHLNLFTGINQNVRIVKLDGEDDE